MDLCTGSSSPPEGTARLRAVPETDSGAMKAAVEGTGDVEDAGDLEDVREDLAPLRDAGKLVTAGKPLDGLRLQLTVNPFDRAAYRGFGSSFVGQGVLALAAYERVSASTVRGS